MPTNPNMVAIQTVTVGSGGAATISFTSIPQTYTDLKIVLSGRTTQASLADSVYFSFNSSTANFSSRILYGDGGSASSFTQARYAGSQPGSTATASTFANIELYIPNYTSSNNKSYSVDAVTENNGTTAYAYLAAGLWSDTSAITSITLTPNAGSFVQYSTATLYGVTSAAKGAKATGGDIITYDGTYFYHIFNSSGTFTPTQSLTADYLVVAGGGGGGTRGGGGGGAGGLRCTVGATGGGGSLESPLSLTAQAYTVTVGAGGASSTSGSNSVFSSITSTGGGRGASDSIDSATGGSGGGGGGDGTYLTGKAGTANQGYAGGNASGGGSNPGGGGGGAGQVGQNYQADGNPTIAGNGGNGVATAISGTSTTYAGGGGGGKYNNAFPGASGTGGTGGGGNGTASGVGGAGTANLGGGGGGGSGSGAGGAGGSGVIVIRYAK